MFQLDLISKTFRQKTVADQISLTVDKGCLLAVLGRSGCGKSTLLNIAAGLLAPDGGRVWLDGEDITRRPAEKRRIALMFQDYALLPHLNVWQNTAFSLKMRGVPAKLARAKAEEMLEQVGLAGESLRRPATLSGGEQQRVALARALASEPKLLLLDEPFSSLDTGLRQNLRELTLRQVVRLNIPAVIVTHDPEEAFFMAGQIALMENGRLIQQDTPIRLAARPVSAAAARLIGCRNVFENLYLPPDALHISPDGDICPIASVNRLPAHTRADILHPRFGRLEISLPPEFQGGEIRVTVDEGRLVHFENGQFFNTQGRT